MAREVVLRFLGDAGNLNRTFAAVEAQSARSMAHLQGSVASASSRMSSSFASVGAGLAAAGATMKRSGAQLTRNVSLPMAVISGLGIKTAIDYEKSMNVLQAVSGATGEQMASFGRLAQALGADITLPGTSAADAALAMVELAKAGLSVEDAMGAAKGVLQLSAAGGLDNATAAAVAANALNAFRLEGSEAVRVADLLAGAANGSSAEVAELADSLAQGASVFAQAGIPIEDFVTSAALLANVGIKGSDAGTSLKSMLLKLQSPTAAAAKQIAGMGVDLYDAQGQMRSFPAIIGQFSTALGKMNQEERDAALGDIFGSDAIRAANAVLSVGVPAFEKMKAVTTEQGAAAKLAAAQNKGLGGALDGLKSAMETLMLRVLVPALPTLTRFVTALANFVPKITSLPKPVLIAAVAFGGLLVAIGPLSWLFGSIASAAGLLLGPFGLVAAAVATVGAAVYSALNPERAAALMEGFKAKWAELAPGVLARLSTLGTTIWTWIQTNGPVILAKLASWAQAFVEWVLPLIPPLLTKLLEVQKAVLNWITGTAVPALSQKLREDWIPAFVNWVAEVGPPLLVELGKLLGKMILWVHTEALPQLAKAFGQLALSLPQGVANAVPGLGGGGGGGKGGKPAAGGAAGVARDIASTGLGVLTGGASKFLGLAHGGLLLGVNRPTPLLVGEGRGKEDVLAVPHSKGGLAGIGGAMHYEPHFYGIPYEEAAERSTRQLGWKMALSGRR